MKKQITFEIEVTGPDENGWYQADGLSRTESVWREWLDTEDLYFRACAKAVVEYIETPQPGKVYPEGSTVPAGYYVFEDGSHGGVEADIHVITDVVYIKSDYDRMTDEQVSAFLCKQLTKEV